MDEPVEWYEGAAVGAGSRRYLHTDHQGSVVAIADAAGTVLGVNRYDPYGVPSAGNLGRYAYTGQTRIDELGLYYYKARIYSPWLGRFLQTDPIGYEDDLNLYAYVGGDPVNNADPTGLCGTGTNIKGKSDSGCKTVDPAFGTKEKAPSQTASAQSDPGVWDVMTCNPPGPDCTDMSPLIVEAVLPLLVGVLGSGLAKVARVLGLTDDAVRGGSGFAREAGILRDAARGKGNFGLGSGTRAEAERLGRAWVGDGAKLASDGKMLVSADGLRQFRPPSFKPNLGIEQANFEQRLVPSGQWFGNGHLDIGP